MEKYSSGRRGAPAKGVGVLKHARVQIPPSPPENQRKTFVFALVFSIPGISYYICSNLHSCDRNRDRMRHLYFLNSSSIPALARRYTLSFSDACAYMSIVNAAVACPSIACTIFVRTARYRHGRGNMPKIMRPCGWAADFCGYALKVVVGR